MTDELRGALEAIHDEACRRYESGIHSFESIARYISAATRQALSAPVGEGERPPDTAGLPGMNRFGPMASDIAREKQDRLAALSQPSPESYVQNGVLIWPEGGLPAWHAADTKPPTGPGWTTVPCYVRTSLPPLASGLGSRPAQDGLPASGPPRGDSEPSAEDGE